MAYEIKRLSAELVNDYLSFFDLTPHSTGTPEDRCYCVCWAAEDCDGRDFSTAEKRREIAETYVKSGLIQGYLAYSDGNVVGWCNANTKNDCYGSMAWKMFMQSVKKDAPEVKVKSIYCFTVAPEMQRKGVATALLRRVCEDAARDGFDFVEAYPNTRFVNTEYDFMGTLAMYEKAGFSLCYEAGDKTVVRKKLTTGT